MFFDRHSSQFHVWRSKASVSVLPLQLAVNYPIKKLYALQETMATQKNLLQENAQLRAHQLLLESKLQRFLELQRENLQLRELLKSSPNVGGPVIVGELLAISLDPALHQMVVDKGSRNGVFVGQPVLDAYGVIGQIVNVGLMTSRVLLVTDSRSAVPVRNARNGIRGIAVGVGGMNTLSLINLPETIDIKVGDVFVSSGLGLRFPVGYPVAVVTDVSIKPHQRFANITLVPAARLNQTEEVLLAWPDKVSLYQEVKKQLGEPLPVATGNKS